MRLRFRFSRYFNFHLLLLSGSDYKQVRKLRQILEKITPLQRLVRKYLWEAISVHLVLLIISIYNLYIKFWKMIQILYKNRWARFQTILWDWSNLRLVKKYVWFYAFSEINSPRDLCTNSYIQSIKLEKITISSSVT